MTGRSVVELCAGYEIMRATATGSSLLEAPRNLALFLAEGLAAWIGAWSPLPPAPPVFSGRERPLAAGFGQEVVCLITEMALRTDAGLAAS
ncbi:MAG: hypothetical protein M0Z40_09840 [Actinomycetota bacterium]|nr:hypothetical protein [Actinomycetota bacterium]